MGKLKTDEQTECINIQRGKPKKDLVETSISANISRHAASGPQLVDSESLSVNRQTGVALFTAVYL